MRAPVVWLALAGLVSGPAPAQPAPGAEQEARPAGGTADLGVLETVRRVAGRVEALRGRKFRAPPLAVRATEDVTATAREIAAWKDVSRERLAARGRAWGDLGLGGAGSPAALRRILAADVEGLTLDPGADRLLVAPGRLTDSATGPTLDASLLEATGVHPDETVASHVLTHLLQRERDPRACTGETTDELLARASLCEGEANLVAARHLFAALGLGGEALGTELDPAQFLDGRLVPRELASGYGAEIDLARFVYVEGFAQAVRAYGAGGWESIDAAAARTRTTRDVLHPGRATPAAALPEPAPPRPELRLLDTDSLGEQGLVVAVSRVTGKDDLALQAGDGWIADRLSRFEAASGTDGVTDWDVRFASAADAEDFHYAALRMVAARYPAAAVESATAERRVLRDAERVIELTRGPNAVRLRIASPRFADPPASAPSPDSAPAAPRRAG